MKRLLSFNPLASTQGPPDVTIQRCVKTRYLEFLFATVSKKFNSMEKYATFGYFVRVFLPTEIYGCLRILNWLANESKNPFVVRPIVRGKVLELSPGG